jgi:hypothetical protein
MEEEIKETMIWYILKYINYDNKLFFLQIIGINHNIFLNTI